MNRSDTEPPPSHDRQAIFGNVRLADLIANDPDIELVADQRSTLGFVNVKCPLDDGTGDHLLFVTNPVPGEKAPAKIYCQSPACADVSIERFIELFGRLTNPDPELTDR